jgi:predicted TIM-barrel fold metal-dependent hydrolase
MHDSHFHLTNYIQEGANIRDFLGLMGEKVGRVALFGIPLQQTWSHGVSGDAAPTYYLESDAPLYYYSFTDAFIAKTYLSLEEKDRARFDPMITGFNPTDMYAADHIRRVLKTFPGVFTGVGEFTIHKEFVSDKVAGGVASLTNPAVDRIFEFCAEVGLVCLIHNDIATPFQKAGTELVYLEQIKALFKRHPKTTIIWAHLGVGRIVRPLEDHLAIIEQMLKDPELSHVNFDISWDEVAKYAVSSAQSLAASSSLINRYPDRFLFGSDTVAPSDVTKYLKTYSDYEPLWAVLNEENRKKVLKGNYERVFDTARIKVREWEAMHAK